MRKRSRPDGRHTHIPRSGIVDSEAWKTLAVADPDGLLANMDGEEAAALAHTLEQDPRPHYHDDPLRIYGMPFGQWEVRFRVCGGQLTIVSLTRGRE